MEKRIKDIDCIPQPTLEDYKRVMSNAYLELGAIVLLADLQENNDDEVLVIGDVLLGALNILAGESNNYIEEYE